VPYRAPLGKNISLTQHSAAFTLQPSKLQHF